MHPVHENLPQERVTESEFDLETELPDIEIMAAPQERDLNTPELPDKGVPKTPVAYPENPIYIPTERVFEILTKKLSRCPKYSYILITNYTKNIINGLRREHLPEKQKNPTLMENCGGNSPKDKPTT